MRQGKRGVPAKVPTKTREKLRNISPVQGGPSEGRFGSMRHVNTEVKA